MLLNYGTETLLSLLSSMLGFFPVVSGFVTKFGAYLLWALWVGELALIAYCLFTVWKSQYTWIMWVSEQINRMA
jgi:hypothetical protein